MAGRDSARQLEARHRLLALCAQPVGHETLVARLHAEAARFDQWSDLPQFAEKHGMGPLLYHHIQAAQVAIPQDTKLALQGMALRHRHINRVYQTALFELLDALDEAGIESLVLKGSALAHLIYPDPALRPVSDIDLHVDADQARAVRALLEGLEYRIAELKQEEPLPRRHLPMATKRVDDVTLSVEVHYHRGQDLEAESAAFWEPVMGEFRGFDGRAQTVEIEGRSVRTLDHETTLHFLTRHLVRHLLKASDFMPMRWIWMADIVGYVAQFREAIDWDRVRAEQPYFEERLAAFHALTPPSWQGGAAMPMPSGIGVTFEGWPRHTLSERKQSLPRFILETLFPSAWWLAFYYGAGSRQRLNHLRWVEHPRRLIGAARWLRGGGRTI